MGAAANRSRVPADKRAAGFSPRGVDPSTAASVAARCSDAAGLDPGGPGGGARFPARRAGGIVLAALLVLVVNVARGTAKPPPPDVDEPDPKPRVILPDESAHKRSASDGKGRVSVQPATVEVSSPVTLEYTFTVAAEGIAAGGGISMSVSRFWQWSPPQTSDPESPGYTTVRCSRGDALTLRVDAVPRDHVVLVRVPEGGPLEPGDTVTLTYGDTSGGRHPAARGRSDAYAERGERFFFKVDGDGDTFFTPLETQATFEVVAREATTLLAFAPSQASVGEPFEISVAAVDRTFNRVESFTGAIALECTEGEADVAARVTISAGDRGAIRVPVTAREPGAVRITASTADPKLASARTNPTLVSAAGKPGLSLLWGDVQIHSNVSDGTAAPEDIYAYARDVARLDFAALTDHDHWGYRPLDTDPTTWRHILEVTRRFNDEGRFVTFPGYEWTNWTFGHRHVLFRHEKDAGVFAWQDERSDHPLELWALLRGKDCITIPHHTGGGPVPVFWKYHDPSLEPVVEICSVHGVSEAMGHPRCIYSPVASGMVQSALARGHRLGFVGSGDSHDGHPGLGSPDRRAGLAAVWATGPSRDAIWKAIRARRVYATTGCRSILRFHMGDTKMGSVAPLGAPDRPRTLSLSVLGDGPIANVTIVKNNVAVITVPAEGELATLDWTDPDPARPGDYYYARIQQQDGEWIWSSPIWIGEARE